MKVNWIYVLILIFIIAVAVFAIYSFVTVLNKKNFVFTYDVETSAKTDIPGEITTAITTDPQFNYKIYSVPISDLSTANGCNVSGSLIVPITVTTAKNIKWTISYNNNAFTENILLKGSESYTFVTPDTKFVNVNINGLIDDKDILSFIKNHDAKFVNIIVYSQADGDATISSTTPVNTVLTLTPIQ